MVRENNVIILAKKIDDSINFLGSDCVCETRDIKIAFSLQNVLAKKGVKVQLIDLDLCGSEPDQEIVNSARILILVATKASYFDFGKRVILKIEADPNAIVEHAFFVTIKGDNDINERDIFSINSYPGPILNIFVEISSDHPVTSFANKICRCLSVNSAANRISFPNELENSYSIGRHAANNVEDVTQREWLTQELNMWVSNGRNTKRFFWLCGEHGSGKTVFIGDYYERLGGVVGKGIYYCKYSYEQNQSVERIIKAIAYKLCECIPGYHAVISKFKDDYFVNSNVEILIASLLIEPFNNAPNLQPNGRIVFIIDGIDELKEDVQRSFLRMLDNSSNAFPPFIRIIITSTSIGDIVNTMKRLSAKTVDLSNPKYKQYKKEDAKRFLSKELQVLGIECIDDQLNAILQKAEWNFDYLHYFLAQCEEFEGKLPPIDKLPTGLRAMFQADFERQFTDDFFNDQIKPILQVLTAAKEPLSVNDLSQMISQDINRLQATIKGVLKQFLLFSDASGTETVSLYNKSLQLWLIQLDHKFCVEVKSGNRIIANWLMNNQNYLSTNTYLQRYGIVHILESGDSGMVVILCKWIEQTDENNFETLKELLSNAFISSLQDGKPAASLLLDIYRSNYRGTVGSVIRYRDLLVYTYRFVLKRRGKDALGLQDIYQILYDNHEEIRAELLCGEGIADYQEARDHFIKTIDHAKQLLNDANKAGRWWPMRMLGVAYNRLANLEKKHGSIDVAEENYEKGKHCFEKACSMLTESEQLQNFEHDSIILQRDKAIINERLGDIAFAKKDFPDALMHYEDFYVACKEAHDKTSSLKNKWDLSISLLRLGDAQRYLGKLKDAYSNFKQALSLRREILLMMQGELAKLLGQYNMEYCPNFKCTDVTSVTALVDEVPRESRDIDPVRDIAMCYVRLGDLAFSVNAFDAAKFLYSAFNALCKSAGNSGTSDRDLELSIERLSRIHRAKGG